MAVVPCAKLCTSEHDTERRYVHHRRSFLAAEAIREYVEINEWQLQEIQNAVAEADAGDFASDDELASLARKWRVDAGA